MSVGLLKRGAAPGEENHEIGVHHFGFQIESLYLLERNLEDFDPSIRIERRPSEDPYAEYRITDPEGVIVDLSERGYGVEGEPRTPGSRHLATYTTDQPRKHAFYLEVLEMRDVTRTPEEIDSQTRLTLGLAQRRQASGQPRPSLVVRPFRHAGSGSAGSPDADSGSGGN